MYNKISKRNIKFDKLMNELKQWKCDYEQEDFIKIIKCISDTLPDKFIIRIINKLKNKRRNFNEAQLERNKDDTLCENISDYHPVDEFICSKCGLIMRELQRYEIDEDTDDENCYEFEFKYCPRCGRKVIE